MSTLFVLREREPERRVSATPDSVKQFVSAGLDVVVQSGAGAGIRAPDAAYEDVGAQITDDRDRWIAEADIVCTVGTVSAAEAAGMKAGAVLVGLLSPSSTADRVKALRDGQVTSLALELVPRITRAQSVDALSSQAGIAGYKAVVLAAATLDKQFALAMTAAGTIRPARMVVIGAGVAGLQAVATARRLGAVVEVSDVRAAVKEEVESLGASFIDPPTAQESDDGYAKEVGKDFLTLQREQLTRHIADAHAVLTTAAIPGRRAPEIITQEMVEAMRPGSVIIDLAAATGGNCTLTPPEGEVEHNGVRIIAAPDLAATMPTESSGLYARNVQELVSLILDEDAALDIDLEDEIVAGSLLTFEGRIHHERTAEQLGDRPPATATDGAAPDAAATETVESPAVEATGETTEDETGDIEVVEDDDVIVLDEDSGGDTPDDVTLEKDPQPADSGHRANPGGTA